MFNRGEGMSYILKLRSKPNVLTDARNISPDKFVNKKLDEIRNLKIIEGGLPITLDTLFDIDGPSVAPQETKNMEITINNSNDKLCFIGYKMSNGRIIIRGDVGHFIGYKMKGGNITIYGNVRNYLGAKMVNGNIEVHGNVMHRVGSKLHGERPGKGMKGGTIHIHGNAGAEIGWGMKGGTIVVDGSSGNLVGTDMLGGTVIIKGSSGVYPGLRMIGGRIVIGGHIPSILPSFYIDSLVSSLKVKGVVFFKPFATFIGDVLVGGRGFLQISYEDNKHIMDTYKQLVEETI
uniref:formylmethanofuran dehydrogenase n=1 Tax=Ignisphaera aggregans TaxID=334771 RepID=A0A7J3MYG2_9CREN